MVPGLAPWPIFWYGDNSYVITGSYVRLQARCRALLRAAAEYGLPFSDDSLEVIARSGGDGYITLEGRPMFRSKEAPQSPRVTMDSKGGTAAAIMAREWAGGRAITLAHQQTTLQPQSFVGVTTFCGVLARRWGHDWRHSSTKWHRGAEVSVADFLGPTW